MSDETLLPVPIFFPSSTPSHYKTVKINIKHREEFLRRLIGYLPTMGLRNAREKDGKILYSRTFPFSLGASVLVFIGVFIIIFFSYQIPYDVWRDSLPLYEQMFLPGIKPHLIEVSILGACGFASAVGVIWGQKQIEWKYLSISEGTNFLYLRFEVSEGDTYMIQLLDEIGIPSTISKNHGSNRIAKFIDSNSIT